jgi:steroid 5-alpha reductase family enzyme
VGAGPAGDGVSGFALGSFLVGLGWSALAVTVLLGLTFAAALRLGRHSVIDVVWGLGFAVVALTSGLLATGHGDTGRRILVIAMTCVWGLRLAAHIGWRSRGASEDPRYVAMLDRAPGNRALYALRVVYLTQGVVLLFISLPVQVAVHERGALTGWTWIGVAVWAVGLFFEALGDRQLSRFRADPANRGRVLDTGLWRYTRHPNYFGDACVWWGLFLVAAVRWPGVLTILSPLLMTYLLANGTGKPLLEERLGSTRAGYASYVARTSGFLPLPPRRRSA